MLTFLVKKRKMKLCGVYFLKKNLSQISSLATFTTGYIYCYIMHGFLIHTSFYGEKNSFFFSNFVSIANLLWIPSDIKRILFRAAPVWKFQCQNCRRGNIPLMSFPGINQPILYFTFLAFKETLLFV